MRKLAVLLIIVVFAYLHGIDGRTIIRQKFCHWKNRKMICRTEVKKLNSSQIHISTGNGVKGGKKGHGAELAVSGNAKATVITDGEQITIKGSNGKNPKVTITTGKAARDELDSEKMLDDIFRQIKSDQERIENNFYFPDPNKMLRDIFNGIGMNRRNYIGGNRKKGRKYSKKDF